ncbi:MAG: hypothetical protein IAE93_07155 [Ignavibacteria bacterium]|nr:hypothetical protein [Ignavibacteria bacterium]
MYLTDNQKQLLNDIVENKIFDVYSYFDTQNDFVHEFYEEELLLEIYPNEYKSTLQGGVYLLPIIKYTKLCQEFFEFIALCQLIERLGMIHTTKMPVDRKWYFPILPYDSVSNDKYTFPDEFNWPDEVRRVNQILYERYLWEFFPYPELHEFIKRGYKTNYELISENEDIDRKKAQKTTLRVALITIVLSVLISISTSVFNYVTYNREREVIIKNVNDFNDTTRVFLINSQTKQDSGRTE